MGDGLELRAPGYCPPLPCRPHHQGPRPGSAGGRRGGQAPAMGSSCGGKPRLG